MAANTAPQVERILESVYGGPFVQALDLEAGTRRQREIGDVPGMLSRAERAMLVALVSRTWRGDGAIIDGGSFFGSSLVASGTGLRESPVLERIDLSAFPAGKPLHGYELGFLPAPKSDKVDRRRVFGGVEYMMGDNFIPILERTIAPYRDLIELHIGDLNEETWDGFPIEIAFIDVCKTIRLNAHVSRQFYPALIPGASTLINQDFFFDRLPWIKVTMGYLADYFRWEGRVFSSSIYTSVKEVPVDVAAFDPFSEGTYEDCLRYHDAVDFGDLDRRTAYRLDLSRGYLMALKGHQEESLEFLRAVADDYADLLDDADQPRGNRFRMDRAVRQITNGNIFKVS